MKLYQITYEVTGSISFPIDMLRYDGSWPADEGQSLPIMDAIHHQNDGPVTVRLRTNRERNWQPTAARWQSFGYSVVEGSLALGPAL